jgi:hypothetical protein
MAAALFNSASAQGATIITTVPEPSSFIQLGAGLFALVLFASIRRKRAISSEAN